MRGFGFSFALGVALYLLMQTPVQAALGFFGAIPVGLMALPFQVLPPPWNSAGAIYAPSVLAIVAHVVFCRRDAAFRDSPFTLLAAGWIPFALGVIQFLCLWQHGGGTSARLTCLVWAPPIT